MFSDSVLKGLE